MQQDGDDGEAEDNDIIQVLERKTTMEQIDGQRHITYACEQLGYALAFPYDYGSYATNAWLN